MNPRLLVGWLFLHHLYVTHMFVLDLSFPHASSRFEEDSFMLH